MAEDKSSVRTDSGDDGVNTGAGRGWTALSYLITGVVVWGVIGWLIDQRFDTGGIATAIGSVVGAAGGVYLIASRFGAGARGEG